MRRRRAGERVILSVGDNYSSKDHRPATAAVAAGLLFVAAAAAYLMLPATVAATRGELMFAPSNPTAGVEVVITYSPAFYLAGEDSLRMRARVRNADSPFPRGGLIGDLRVTTLRRNSEGRFEGRLQIKEDDLFVVAAVEDFGALNVDTNFGQLWELFVSAEDGEPSVAALESRYRVLEPYNWVMASAWAEEITQRWPDSPFGWALLYYRQSRIGPIPDSVVSFHRTKLRYLIARQAQRRRDTEEIARLSSYARLLGDGHRRDSLLDRVSQLDPNHAAVVDRQVLRAISESKSDIELLLGRLNDIWATTDQSNEFLVRLAVQTAAARGDPIAVRIWLARGRELPGITMRQLFDIMEPFTELATERLEILRARLTELESLTDEKRPLRKTVTEHELDVRQTLQGLRLELAGALADSGDTTAAVELYSESADYLWKPEEVQPYVDFLLARGDTVGALPGIGLLASDPILGAALATQYSDVISLFDSDSESIIEKGRAELARRVTRLLSPTHSLPGNTLLTVRGKRTVEAAEYLGDAPTVLLLWDTRFPDAESVLAEFDSLARQDWAMDNIRALVVVPRVANLELKKLAGTTLPILHDAGFQLTEALQVFRIPAHVILDVELNVLAVTPDAVTAFRIASALAAQ